MLNSWLEPLPLVAILRGIEPDEAVDIGHTLADAGFHMLEVPLNSPSPSRVSSASGKCWESIT